MKRCLLLNLIISILSFLMISCASDTAQDIYSREDRMLLDSLVRAQRTPDSLLAVAARFADEDNFLGEVIAYRELGRMYRNTSRFQEAIDIHIKGLHLAERICDTLQVIQALNNIGTAYRRIGALEEAATWHYQGLTWCERWNDTTSVALKNRVVSLNGLGNVFLSMGRDSLAMTSFSEALKGETKLGSTLGMAINYANIGALHEGMGQIDSARYYYGLSLKCNEQIGSSLGISLCHGHFGRLAEREDDWRSAYEEYKSAYDVLSLSQDKWHWLESCISLARISMKLGNVSAIRSYLDEALDVAEGLDSPAHLAEIYNLYYVMARKEKLFDEALQWHEKYSDCQNRLYSERKDEAIFELRSQYEREKNREEIRILSEAHRQKVRRDRMFIFGVSVVLVFAVLAIVFLVYSLRLRSRNNKILKELDRARNNYFTDIAHEFRTPLTIILSAAGNIYDNAEDDGLKDDASDIKRHSKGLLNLVNQVLDIAKMTSGLAPEPVWRSGNIVAFISGICEHNRRYAESKGIKLDFVYSSDLIEMDFVPDLMVRIVQNLISNALKFSERDTCVSVSLYRRLEDAKGYLCISVRDQGIGMTPQQIEDVFKPYYQAEGRLKDMGTGLGLSVVKLAAEAMGGSVDVESAVGQGTEFIVDIPVRHDMAVSSIDGEPVFNDICVPEAGAPAIADDASQDPENPRILIVEDAPEVARWEMRQLGRVGYTFCYASDGAEGLRKAEEIMPDMIITDVSMPVMDGLQMCRRIRRSEQLCHIPVIMVTARVTHEDRLKGLEAGADAYLEKPYDENELNLRVRKLLHQRSVLKKFFTEKFEADEMVSFPVESSISVIDRLFIEKFDAALEEAFVSGKVDCEDLASAMCIGRAQLNRKMKAITGYKTTEYILMHRLSKARTLLRTTDLPIGEISMQCGIEDVGYFSTLFRKHVGMAPSAYRNQ